MSPPNVKSAAARAGAAWVWRLVGAVSVRYKILGIVLTLVAVLGLSVTIQVRGILTRALDGQLEQRAVAVALDLAGRAEQAAADGDSLALKRTLGELRLHNQAVSYAQILDEQGAVVAETDGLPESDSLRPPVGVREARVSFEGGVVRVGMSEGETLGVVEAVTGQILLSTLSFAVMGVVAASVLTWVLTRPLKQLTAAAQAIAGGRPAERVPRWADDEFGDLAEAFNAMGGALDQAAAERAERRGLQDRFVRAVIDAQEDERKRVARELHDGTSQSLTSLIIGIKNVADVADSRLVRERVEDLRGVAVQALDDVHSLATRLRPPVLDDLGLGAALERYVAECRIRFKIRIDLVTLGRLERLPVEVETAVYRVVQEAMTNVIRHAEAANVGVVVERHRDFLRVGIEDDGRGFDREQVEGSGRLGLAGMRERAELLGGAMRIDSQPGRGTTVTIEIPLTAAGLPASESGDG